jgi:hypothetical protein
MVRDSAILLSLRPLAGIEVARIRLDGNGFLILDRLDRVYAEGDYGLLDSFPNIIIPPFAHIQELLDRRLFVEEEIPLFPKFVALRFSHVQTDVTVDMDVPIPPKYRRISIQELFLLIQQKL